MDAATIERLVDLLSDLDRAGVQELIPDGDRLRYRPRSAVTPDLAERLRTHKADLLAVLRPPAEAPDVATSAPGVDEPDLEPIRWEDPLEPPEPCPGCGGLVFWWSPSEDRRCMRCEPPTTAIRLLERAHAIRRRQGIPGPADVAEMLGDLKRLIGTCN